MAGPEVLDAPLVAGCVAATHNMTPAASNLSTAAAASTGQCFSRGLPSTARATGGAGPIDGQAARASVDPIGRAATSPCGWLRDRTTPGTSLRRSPAAAAGTSGTGSVVWMDPQLQQASPMPEALQAYNQSMSVVDVHNRPPMERPDLA